MTDPVLSLAEITADWLSACLQRHGYATQVMGFTASPIGTGQAALIKRPKASSRWGWP